MTNRARLLLAKHRLLLLPSEKLSLFSKLHEFYDCNVSQLESFSLKAMASGSVLCLSYDGLITALLFAGRWHFLIAYFSFKVKSHESAIFCF